ncbi:hypothetical protein [Foetidibacter luteolus]|uniref:hypothetical protein n=1 Tax=Foetidibacter luteolus TaxID=2608880 RepID=UPI00129C0478|nr:hypothetical protein [Foetidibacter luteolus]
MYDGIKARGAVRIEVWEGDTLRDVITENNLVVTLGKTNIARLLGGHASGKKIEKIGIGTSSNVAAAGDSSLTNAFIKAIDTVSYPDAQSVQYNFDIDNGEGNGLTIREFGLYNTDNVLCARKVRTGEITKTNLIRLVGSWKITIN